MLYSLQAAATEPLYNYWSLHTLEPMLSNRRSHRNRSQGTAIRKQPLLATLEKAGAQQQRSSAAKNNKHKI